jgi:hypothetical protein
VTVDVSAGRIHAILESLIGERKRLQHEPHAAPLMEANRMAISYWQEQLERHREQPGAASGRPRSKADTAP